MNYDGTVAKEYDYDAYGNELQRDLNDENPFRYCGEYYDTETGFIYLRARYYDPMVGRFTSVDPIKDGLNWYSYCYNNPVFYRDENGLFPMTALLITMGAALLLKMGDYVLAECNYRHNSAIDSERRKNGADYGQSYIGSQKYPLYEEYMYGFFDKGYNTCEVIAIHNVKIELGMESTLTQTIYDMQTVGGMWFYGIFGSFPSYVNVMLQEYGIEFRDIFGVDEMTDDGMYIVSYWNKDDEDVFYGIHTIAIKKQGDSYQGYNYEGNLNDSQDLTLDDLKQISDYYLSGCYIIQ